MKHGITPLMIFFLACSILGLIVPWYFNLQHILYSPIALTVSEYYRQGTATPLAASLTWDLLIGATAATTFMMIEIRRLNMRFGWLYLVATFLFAFACAFPLFMFMRERQLQKIQ